MANNARGEFNMSAEIRTLLIENWELTESEIVTAMQKKFPRRKINHNSCRVSSTVARRKLRLLQAS
jgi:hypothetical protein